MGKRLTKAFRKAFNCYVRGYNSAVFYEPTDDGKKTVDRRLTLIEHVNEKGSDGNPAKGPTGPGYPCFVSIPKGENESNSEDLTGKHLAFQASIPDTEKENGVK